VNEYLLRRRREERGMDSLEESSTEDKGGEEVLRCPGGSTGAMNGPSSWLRVFHTWSR